MAKINDLWDGSLDKRKVRSLAPCCGQDGYRARVPQHPIDFLTFLDERIVAVLKRLNSES